MRRATGLTVLLLLLAACVGQTPPPRTPLTDVALIVPEPQSCAFQIGEGRGVSIDDIIPNSGAEGVLAVGDLLVGLDGTTIANADQLRQVLSRRQAGEEITVDVIRAGEQVSAEILLGSNPEAPERPLLGVMIVTAFDRLEPDQVGTDIESGRLARTVGIGSSIYILDPASGNWASLGGEMPDGAWAAAGQAILTLEDATTAKSALVDTVTGDRLVFDLGDWWGANILGSLGSDTVMSAVRLVPGDASLVEVAVVLIDFHRRVVEWIWQIDQPLGVPVAAFPSPDGARILVAGQDQGDDVLRYAVLSADNGFAMTSSDTLAAAESTAALGWFDEESFLASTASGNLLLVDAATGTTNEAALPVAVRQVTRLATVGDGVHLLADTGSSLIKVDLSGTAEIRTLADHCQVGVIGSLGWAAAG